MPGKVYLVGAGPGDPGLLTLRGAEILKRAEAVLYDRLISDELLGLVPEDAVKINVGKRSGAHSVPQERINRLLLEYALDGKTVVRLKGGDSFVFGRGGEELELLWKNNVPFEVVPGITSAAAVPAYAGIPVTHRGTASAVHIITAHTKEGINPDMDLSAYAKIGGTLVFLMGASLLGYIMRGLIDGGMDRYTPCAVIERGATPRQRKTLGTISDIEKKVGRVESPAVIVVGGVCELSDRYDWFSRLPLYGKRIAVTGKCEKLSPMLRELGAEVTDCPSIRTEPILDRRASFRLKREIGEYDTMVFTSANGVKYVMDALYGIGFDARVFGGKIMAAIGPATAEALKGHGIVSDIMPEKYSGKALARALKKAAARGGRLLLLRAETPGREINDILDESGIEYRDKAVYRTVPECTVDVTEPINRGMIDYVTFASGSAVRGFMNLHTNIEISGFKAVCIGESTAAEAKRSGMRCITAEKTTLKSIVEAILTDQEGT